MGEKNSSDTRVRPLGVAITNNHALLSKLLSLVKADGNVGDFENKKVFYTDTENEKKEKSLPPTPVHLMAIIDKIVSDNKFREIVKNLDKSTSKNNGLRKKIFNPDEKTIKKAEEKIKDGKRPLWCKFEGNSRPDLFIENDKYIVLVEGKRTEPKLTDSTSYLEHRSQMVRHIENALYYGKGKKKVIAFYIIEKGCGYKEDCKKDHFEKVLDEETIKKDSVTKTKILDSFYGYTTWDEIEEKLHIRFEK